MKVVTAIGSLHDPARLGPWLYSLARFTAIDHIRDAAARRRLVEPLAHDAVDGAAGDDLARSTTPNKSITACGGSTSSTATCSRCIS